MTTDSRLPSPAAAAGPSLHRRLDRYAWGCVVIGSVLAASFNPLDGMAWFLGGGMSWINFRWMWQSIGPALTAGRDTDSKRVRRYLGRYALLAVCLYVTIRGLKLSPAFLFLGLFAHIQAVLIMAAVEVARHLFPAAKSKWKSTN